MGFITFFPKNSSSFYGSTGKVVFANIGLDEIYKDNGLGAITKKNADNGRFKAPNLNNIALTAPYMHDGRFATLKDVVNHYDVTFGLALSEQQKVDLVEYLKLL